MNSRSKRFFLWFACIGLATSFNACRSGPKPLQQPYIDPTRAGKLAMEQYDKNGDGVVSGGELDQAPALKEALARLDTNGDGAVSADEVAERVNAWKAMEVALASVPCRVMLDGQALAGATISFEPEAFLGEEIKAASAITSLYGDAAPTIPPEQRPTPKTPGGVHLGLYKVRISKVVNGKETIPSRYNSETTIGLEVSYDNPAVAKRNVNFAVKSK